VLDHKLSYHSIMSSVTDSSSDSREVVLTWSSSQYCSSHGTFDNFFHQTHSRFSHNMTPKNLNFLLRTPRDSVSVCGESVPVFSTTHSRVRSSVSDTLKITVQFHHISHTPIISSERQLSY